MKTKPRYFTHSHNIDGCLRNGSYCRQEGDTIHQYMNGDYMGTIAAVPFSMMEVSAEKAKKLLPKCCK